MKMTKKKPISYPAAQQKLTELFIYMHFYFSLDNTAHPTMHVQLEAFLLYSCCLHAHILLFYNKLSSDLIA
jgi:hypothetical protein